MATKKQAKTADKALRRLYDAAAAYVESRGGKLVVVGGVTVQQWPDDLKFNWTLGIRCTGKRPTYADNPEAAK